MTSANSDSLVSVEILGEEGGCVHLNIQLWINLAGFGRRVNMILWEKGITIPQLAEMINFDQRGLVDALLSPDQPRWTKIRLDLFNLREEVAKALGVSLTELLPEPVKPPITREKPIIIHPPTFRKHS